ncbi:MAG: hypothetical protein HY821_11215 [Acidobacteria bacterium]|nr:hypothetical protein [Acidobacteriota bacterium]
MKITRRSALAVAAGLPIARLAAAPASLAKDGALLIAGVPTFLNGLYQLPNHSEPHRAAAAAGFQVVHAGVKPGDLDSAHAHGLSCWLTTGSISPARRDQDRQRIAALVNQFKQHPALLFWETEDEPSYQWKKSGPRVPPEVIRETYAYLRSLDPAHPVYLNHPPTNLVSTLQSYNPGGDILGTDIYPVIPHGIRDMYALWPDGRQGDLLNTHISQVGPYADKLRQVAGPSRAVVMVLQAFAWENLRDKGRDPAMVLYPTRDQLRFMACQSIVHGANGLLWWGLQFTPAAAPLWDDLAAVTRELRTLDRELVAPRAKLPLRIEYHDTGHSLDRGIEWIARRSASGTLLMAVNADPNPVRVTWTGLPGGPLTEQYAPFDVKIHKLPQ